MKMFLIILQFSLSIQKIYVKKLRENMSFEFKLNIKGVQKPVIKKEVIEEKKDFVKGVSSEGAIAVKVEPLMVKKVIKLVEAPWSSNNKNSNNNSTNRLIDQKEMDLNDKARAALLNEMKGETGEEEGNGRVVEMEIVDESLKDVPLLLRNKVPGLI